MLIKIFTSKNSSKNLSFAGSSLSVVMVMLLTILSIFFVAILIGVIDIIKFSKYLGFSEVQSTAVNMVFLRMRELAVGIFAIISKVLIP